MGKNFTTAFALCLAISALPLACGDDEEDDGSSSKGGKGGSAGSSTGGRGGSAGSATGGRGGSAGATTGGRGGNAGSGGMTGGTAGSATGGMGGAEGGMGGDGMGGEGGQPVDPPMTLCEQVCDGPSGDCAATCATVWCPGLNANPGVTCDPLIEALQTCLVTDDDPAHWTCTQGVPQYDTGGGDCAAEAYAAYSASCLP